MLSLFVAALASGLVGAAYAAAPRPADADTLAVEADTIAIEADTIAIETDMVAVDRDSLYAARAAELQASYQAELQALRQSIYDEQTDTQTSDPTLYQLLGPATYYTSATDHLFSLDSLAPNAADEQLARFYMQHPELVRHYDQQYAEVDAPNLAIEETTAADVTEAVEAVEEALVGEAPDLHEDIDDIGLQVERPNFWTTSASFSLQFTQNYFSENWYKGGSNTQTMLAGLTMQANYNDEQKVTWENKLTMKLGFVTSPSDTCHSLLTNNDKLNLYSKLGVQAHKSWYYAMSLEANTQFLAGYNANDPAKYSNFLAPLDVYVSIGMDYKPTLSNGNSLSIALLPLSYKFRYIGDADENIHSAYSMEDKDTQHDFGSKIELNASVTLAKSLTWKLRSYYYTTYSYTEAELENTFSYAFNKYLSTELYTLWRFDDNRSRDYWDDNLGYFQFKEYFTFGLSYTF